MKSIHYLLLLIIFSFPSYWAMAEMRSSNYAVPEDSVNVGGVPQTSDNYYSNESIGEMGTGEGKSANYILDAGFWAMVGDDEVLTFSITDATADLGTLSSTLVKADTAEFRAATTAEGGYVIEFIGNTLASPSNNLEPLVTPDRSSPGDEQFGFNLMENGENGDPIIGLDPIGGSGQAASGYSTPDSYKFNSGDIIAQSAQPSVYTDYTVSFIGNISGTSDAGDYGTTLTVLIAGRF